MNENLPRRATKAESAYVKHMAEVSAFDLLGLGKAKILTPKEYPEPVRRFLARERTMLHLKLPAAVKRRLEARSQQTGESIDMLARRWIEQGLKREAG